MSLTVVSCLTASSFSARCISLEMIIVIRLVFVLIDLSPSGYVLTGKPSEALYTQGGDRVLLSPPPAIRIASDEDRLLIE